MRNRSEFIVGRDQIRSFLAGKWDRELDYRLVKALWAFTDNHIAVRFQYEWHDNTGQWHRSYGNEQWEFDEHGLMRPAKPASMTSRSWSPNADSFGRLPALDRRTTPASPTSSDFELIRRYRSLRVRSWCSQILVVSNAMSQTFLVCSLILPLVLAPASADIGALTQANSLKLARKKFGDLSEAEQTFLTSVSLGQLANLSDEPSTAEMIAYSSKQILGTTSESP